jgi:hypothetical protein
MPATSVPFPLDIEKVSGMSNKDAGGTLFEDAPLTGLQRRLGLLGTGRFNVGRRALLVILVGWAPLIVLAIAQSLAARVDVITPMLWEIGAHARYLIAAPLLVLAETVCAPQLNEIVRHFASSGIVSDHDRGRFDEIVASTRQRLQSNAAQAISLLLAYLITFAATLSFPLDQLPAWAAPVAGVPLYSLAGWWHTLVSVPLLLLLIFGWFWRLALWTRALWCVSRLELRLVASHPDHCAGLSFLGHSVRAFAIVALALAVIIAGRSAHVALEGGALPTPYFFANAILLLTIMVLFVAPLVLFTPTLMRAWRHGEFAYGALADQVGHAFERKWLGQNVDKSALEKPDFSATTDLYAVVANVHAIRFVPVDLKDLTTIVIAMLLPFIPVVLLAFPLDAIWAQIKSLLF